MRVIAGTARRRVLVAPVGNHTRPTSDRAKEGLFSMIQHYLAQAVFLDLFCGSGAIGIEALSRGAAQAVFVDNDRHALAALTANLAHTQLAAQAEVLPLAAEVAIRQLSPLGRRYDIIFLDPPYQSEHVTATVQQLHSTNLLAEDGLLVVEQKELAPAPKTDFALEQVRCYGRTAFLFYRYKS